MDLTHEQKKELRRHVKKQQKQYLKGKVVWGPEWGTFTGDTDNLR